MVEVGDRFEVEISDGTCVDVEVTDIFSYGSPMVVTGWGFGDAEPPEYPEFDWLAYDLETGQHKPLEAVDADIVSEYIGRQF